MFKPKQKTTDGIPRLMNFLISGGYFIINRCCRYSARGIICISLSLHLFSMHPCWVRFTAPRITGLITFRSTGHVSQVLYRDYVNPVHYHRF